MIVKSLQLRQFRNYQDLNLTFRPGLNVLEGENGVGKTNVVEAIYYLSFARSFRSGETTDLIAYDCDFASIEAEVLVGAYPKRMRIVLSSKGKQIICNGKEVKRLSELADFIHVLEFDPRDVNLFDASPKYRRNFLDIQLSKRSIAYLEAMTRYEKLLKERNAILKENQISKEHLEVVTEMMGKEAYIIDKERKKYLRELNPIVNKVMNAIGGDKREISLQYQPFVDEEEESAYTQKARELYQKAYETDVRFRATSIGIHREDFSTCLNGREIDQFGSQGEKRMAALSIKVAPYFLIEEKEKRPIVVLDDVLSELDETGQERLLSFFERFEQVFLTGTKVNRRKNAHHYKVMNGRIKEGDELWKKKKS